MLAKRSSLKIVTIILLVGSLAGCKAAQTLVYPGEVLYPSLGSARVLKELNADPGAKNLWSVVKTYTTKDSYSVFQGPDNQFYAIDTYSFSSKNSFSNQVSSGVILNVKYNDYYDENGKFATSNLNQKFPYGAYFDPNTGIAFEAGDYNSKDLEALGSALNDEEITSLRIGLVSEFGLSEARASEISSMASSLSAVLQNQNRALTERDLNSLQVKAMGFTVAELVKAKTAGDAKAISEFARSAAQLNKISVEQAKRLINKMSL